MVIKYIKSRLLIVTLSTLSIGASAQISNNTSDEERSDSIINVAFGSKSKSDIIKAVGSVNISKSLDKSFGTYSLENLETYIGGYTGNIWGQAPLILVDGIPRDIGDVRLVEVESISVLKDASSVALYGSAGSRGVVLVNTKRGSIKPLTIDLRANTGINTPKRYPKYLGAAEYMTYYNEASRNDGIAERYSAEQIYHTAAGTNPYKYPDLNLFTSDYLRDLTYKSDLTTEISGGSDRAKYYSNIGLSYNNDILKIGEAKNNNSLVFNVRTNVDMNLTKWLKASTDAVAIVDDQRYARGNFWGAAHGWRPNHDGFIPFVPIDMLDLENPNLQNIVNSSNHIIDGKYLLGGLSSMQTNDLSQIVASGYIRNKNRTFMFNASAEADLSSITEGLRFSTRYSMDYTSRYTEGYSVAYATYQPIWSDIEGRDVITGLTKFGNDANSTNEFVGTSLYYQTTSVLGQFDYQRSFGNNHHVDGKLLGWGYMQRFSSDPNTTVGGSNYHPIRNTNLGIQAAYNFAHKYYADFSASVVHSVKLPTSNRRALSPSMSLGWKISEEDFFKSNNSLFDNLIFTASYSNLKQDLDINGYYLFQGNYDNSAVYYWRDGISNAPVTIPSRGSNPNLRFVERQEFRVGMDASLLSNRLEINANYFKQNIDGLLTSGATIFPSYYNTGMGNYLPQLNYNRDMREGFDFSIKHSHKIGNVDYTIGAAGMFYNSKAAVRDELYEDAYQNRAGQPLDAYWGYVAEGFFQSQEDIDGHARQTLGGELQPGDIKYQDINNDGVIDSRDQINLGHNGWAVNPFTYGLNLTLKWKNLTFFAVGSGIRGAIGFRNTDYFWVRGLNKYSEVVRGRWTPENADDATYPRLTTTNSGNNFQNSTFWMYKNNRFNLSRIQVTYDLVEDIFRNNSVVKKMSFYANGDNLLVVSKEQEMMETNIGTGPQYRFFNLGVRATFNF